MSGTPKRRVTYGVLLPHPCVVLSVDPGAVSGWAIMSGRPPAGRVASGTATSPGGRAEIVAHAQRVADADEAKLIVCAETWSSHGAFGGARTQRGLGAAWGRWAEQIEAAGIPKRRIVRVYPATWRGAVLGVGGRGATTEACRAAAIAYVKRRFGIDAGPDEAEAVCIGVYGMHCAEVGELLPRKRGRS